MKPTPIAPASALLRVDMTNSTFFLGGQEELRGGCSSFPRTFGSELDAQTRDDQVHVRDFGVGRYRIDSNGRAGGNIGRCSRYAKRFTVQLQTVVAVAKIPLRRGI